MVEVMKGIEQPFIVCVSSGKKCSFLGKFGVLCLLETHALRFALLSHYLNDLCTWQCTPTPGFVVAKLLRTSRRRGERRVNDAFKSRIWSNKCRNDLSISHLIKLILYENDVKLLKFNRSPV